MTRTPENIYQKLEESALGADLLIITASPHLPAMPCVEHPDCLTCVFRVRQDYR